MQNYEEIVKQMIQVYTDKYIRFAFRPNIQQCIDERQYEAVIMRLQHGIEKGLSAFNYRPGAGQDYFFQLVSIMKQYKERYSTSTFFYETALSSLEEYIKRNKSEGYNVIEMENLLKDLYGKSNNCGGTMQFVPKEENFYSCADFLKLAQSRHSIRHFSTEPVSIDKIKEAIKIAQLTPSACNRQGWKSRIIINEDIKHEILKNQNGNRGFREEIDKLIVITFDLHYSNIERELYQAFIDGGMYAMSVLYALHYMGIASIPLSASLHAVQEKNIRDLIKISEAEVLILFIGVGNYADKCTITISKRKEPSIEVI